MITRTVVQHATTLLENPHQWCIGHFAVDALSAPVPVNSPEAAAWCLEGAFCRSLGREPTGMCLAFFSEADALVLAFSSEQYPERPYINGIVLNDHGGYAVVMRFLAWLLDVLPTEE